MVGRSKPTKNMVQQSNVEFNAAENLYLKAKNIELAKALADSKNALSQIVDERDFLQRELFQANLRNTKLDNYIKNIDSAARACINTIVTSSNHVTEILQITNSVKRLTSIENETLPYGESRTSLQTNLANNSHGQSNKTQAVKPMIGGHVILRPTINLRRVNEIPLEEIQRLQSSSNRDNLNDDSSSGGSQNEESPTMTSSFRCPSGSSNARVFRNYQQAQPELAANHEVEEEFTDHSSEMSDMGSRLSNGLGTVLEEQESELTNSLTNENINSQANASSTSINIPGTSSQVPLLSGVFRDVRVYLSPMQNMAQYMDPRQNVTTERGSSKSHKSARSQSIHSARSAENVHRTSVESRKRSVDHLNNSIAQNNVNLSGSMQNQINRSTSNANSSAETSCNSVLQNPILTSTKISLSKSAKNNNSSYTNSLGWQNETLPNNSNSTVSNALNEKWTPFTSRTPEFSRRSLLISKNKSAASTTDYDPLEGPSTMLDSFDDDTKNKIETLSGLGLAPTFLENNTSTPHSPWSPAAAVLQRRKRELKESNESTPKQSKKSMHVTKRRSIEKRKATLVSSKVAKIVIKRMSLSKYSGSPKKRSSESLKRESSESPKRKSLQSPSPKGSLQSSKTNSPKGKSLQSPSSKGSLQSSKTKSPKGKSLQSPSSKRNLRSPSSKGSLQSPKRKSVESPKKAAGKPTKRKIVTSFSKAQRNTKSASVTPQSKTSTGSGHSSSTSSKKLPKKREAKSKTLTPSTESDSKSETPTTPGRKRGRPRRLGQHMSFKEPSLRKKMRRSK